MQKNNGQILLFLLIGLLVIGIILASNIEQLTVLSKEYAYKQLGQGLFKQAEFNLVQLEKLVSAGKRTSHNRDDKIEDLGLIPCAKVGQWSAQLWRLTSKVHNQQQQRQLQSVFITPAPLIPVCSGQFLSLHPGRQSWRWIA